VVGKAEPWKVKLDSPFVLESSVAMQGGATEKEIIYILEQSTGLKVKRV
jgi:hypothetical protein